MHQQNFDKLSTWKRIPLTSLSEAAVSHRLLMVLHVYRGAALRRINIV
jgi:hypothetical protein